MSNKSKSALSETPNSMGRPATPNSIRRPSTPNSIRRPSTPRVSKTSRGMDNSSADSVSPLQNAHLSVDQSPRSVTSKPLMDRWSPRPGTPTDKKTSRILKPSELQAELSVAQEDLKKTREKLILVEKVKSKALAELKDAKRSAEEANEKFKEACAARKRAEDNFEIEMFRAVEIEQVAIEAAEEKEDEWHRELEAVREQRDSDLAALLSATHELQNVKYELAMARDAKNEALGHAEDAMKIAEIHAEKVEAISAELNCLKSLLDSRVEMETNEKNRLVSESEKEIISLRKELEKVSNIEKLLAEREAALERINIDLEAAKLAESYTHNLVEELHERVEELTHQAEQAKKLERSASESLVSASKQLEENNVSLRNAESEVLALKEKAALLEVSVRRQKGYLEESERRIELTNEEASEMAKTVESLRSELETVEEEKTQALNNEKLLAASIQTLLEEKNKLISELDASRDEEEKTKAALESLASALHEVSSEARDAKERLLCIQVENENYATQIEDLNLVLKATGEKYESMLDDAKQQIVGLTSSIEQSKHEYQNLKAELEQKELHLTNSVKKSEEDNSCMQNEISRLLQLLKTAEEETWGAKEDEDRWRKSFKETESEVIYLKEVVDEAKAESLKIKEVSMDKENEFQNALRENEELRKREVASLTKAGELSKLLEEALAKKETESKTDLHMVPNTTDFSDGDGVDDVKPMVEFRHQPEEELPITEKLVEVNDVLKDEVVQRVSETENSNGKIKDNEHKENDNEDPANVYLKTSESVKIGGEHEAGSFEDEPDSKADDGDNVNVLSSKENGGSSPSKQHDEKATKKKKSPLLGKFGSLLKKKSPKK